MKRKIFHVLAVASFLLALVASYLWWRGWHVETHVTVFELRYFAWISRQGEFQFAISAGHVNAPGDPEDGRLYPDIPFEFDISAGHMPSTLTANEVWGFGYTPATPWRTGGNVGPDIVYTYRDIRMPAWFAVLLFAFFPVYRVVAWFRGRRKRVPFACRGCGYDLRGHVGTAQVVCPECGVASQATAAMQVAIRRPFWRRALVASFAIVSLLSLCLAIVAACLISGSYRESSPVLNYNGGRYFDDLKLITRQGQMVLVHQTVLPGPIPARLEAESETWFTFEWTHETPDYWPRESKRPTWPREERLPGSVFMSGEASGGFIIEESFFVPALQLRYLRFSATRVLVMLLVLPVIWVGARVVLWVVRRRRARLALAVGDGN